MHDDIKDMIQYKDLDISDYSNAWELYDALDYDGSVHELVDGMIDIYYHDLRQWAVSNWQYVDDARDEGLITENCDYHQQIQAGQYIYYRQQANQAIEEVYDELTDELDETA
jgi:hypothetical protein